MSSTDCSCGRIAVGMTITANRNWNPECAEHGLRSDWYRSPEQVTRRAQADEQLRDLYARARAARQAAREGRS